MAQSFFSINAFAKAGVSKATQTLKFFFAIAIAVVVLLLNLCLLLFAEEYSGAKPVKIDTSAPPAKTDPLELTLETTQNIYSSRQGLMMKLEIVAKERVKVCLAKDIMSQLQVKVYKSGVSKPLKPLVINDNSEIFNQPTNNRWFDPGEKMTYRINLKRLGFADGSAWLPGEYSATATYMLCPQTVDKPKFEDRYESFDAFDKNEAESEGEDIPIKAKKMAWFMIMS
ncbi:MAG: hypothetical protein VKJ04_02275 [Vampirovibrionales bacterium]|nr:hypothetical protein [Vampirovibrionales bacterium]